MQAHDTFIVPSEQKLKNCSSSSSCLYRLLHSLGLYSRSRSLKTKYIIILTIFGKRKIRTFCSILIIRTVISIFDQLSDFFERYRRLSLLFTTVLVANYCLLWECRYAYTTPSFYTFRLLFMAVSLII